MRIGPYEVEREAGRGGMGVVTLARAEDGRPVAVKLLARKDEPALRRFEREVRLQSALGEEAGFVPILATGVHEGSPYLVMPFLEGGTLRQRLERGPLAVAEVRTLGATLARALGKAHERGIVHRDVKPENVLFTERGAPLVTDLGLAKHFDDSSPGASRTASLTAAGNLVGTVSYMAPEQLANAKAAGPAADVFALGAVLYECLAGVRAFPGETVLAVVERIERGTFVPLARFRPDVPRELARVVERALARDPAGRFADGAALERALLATTAGPRGRRAAPIALALLGIGGGLALLLRSPSSLPPESSRAAPLTRLALELAAANDERARAVSLEAVAADASFAPAHAALALALREAGSYDEAYAEGERATALDKGCALAWAARAWATHDAEGSLASAEKAIALDPSLAWSWLARAGPRSRTERERASADVTRAIELDRRLAPAWALRGKLRGSGPDAIADLGKAIELAPRMASAYQWRGTLRQAQGDAAGALEDANRAVELDPDARNLAYRAAARIKAGQEEDGALDDVSRAIALEEEFPLSWEIRAQIRAHRGDRERALSDASRAAELEPGTPLHWLTLANLRSGRAEKAEARAAYERFVALAPADPMAASARQWLAENPPEPPGPLESPERVGAALQDCVNAKDTAGALARARQLVALAPGEATTWLGCCDARVTAWDLAAAEEAATQAIDLAPGEARTWCARARIRAFHHDVEGALADDARALALAPASAGIWAHSARVHRLCGDRGGHLSAGALSLACVPLGFDGSVELARALEENGHLAAARTLIEEMLALRPGDPFATEWLAKHPR